MTGVRAADEAHRGHAVAVLIDRPLRRRPHHRVVRETQVVVGAEVDDVALAGAHHAALGAGEHALALVEALLAQTGELAAQALDDSLIHEMQLYLSLNVRARSKRPSRQRPP